MTDAPFRDSEHAVRFAYAIREYSGGPENILAKLARMGKAAYIDLTPRRADAMTNEELHAQGSMILTAIAQLPSIEMATVVAWYSWGGERALAIQRLEMGVRDMTGKPITRLSGDCLLRAANRLRGVECSTLQAIGERNGKGITTIHTRSDKIEIMLTRWHMRAMDLLDQRWAGSLIPANPDHIRWTVVRGKCGSICQIK